MKTRIIASVILLPLLLVILLAAPTIFTAILFSVIAAIAAFELTYGTKMVRHMRLVAYSALAAALVPIWSHFGCNPVAAEAGVLVFFGLMFMEMMLSHTKLRFEKIAVCAFAGLLIPYLLSALVRLITSDNGRILILIPFVIAFLSDSGAYFVGCKFGVHKMAPVISPKKSVEGLLGGIIVAIVGMLIFTMIMQFGFQLRVNYIYAGIYGILGSLAGVFGDLCFSVVKRQTGIKDYSNLIPGHGGALDRFDSVIVVAPLVELLLAWIPVVMK